MICRGRDLPQPGAVAAVLAAEELIRGPPGWVDTPLSQVSLCVLER